MSWNPPADPFPGIAIKSIGGFEYLDELNFRRHAKSPPETSDSLWQLAADFSVRFELELADGSKKKLELTAPRGMYTDLASVPKLAWSAIGPIGAHLEASIVHDYLFMAWTDYRNKARRVDFDFANGIFAAGLFASKVPTVDRVLILAAVSTSFAWRVFAAKPYTFEERMNGWLPNLAAGHKREG
jgi:hypothetical protein